MTVASFSKLATATATTTRSPAKAGGKVGDRVANISTPFAVVPVMPITPEMIDRYRLRSPRESCVTHTQAVTDILEGDGITVDSVEYEVVGVAPWPAFLEIVLELVSGT